MRNWIIAVRSWDLGAFAALLLAGMAGAQNPIVTENLLPGSPPSSWYEAMPGDASIQGFATDFSVQPGETVHFKIDTDASAYHIDVYRLGWYQGLGARLVGAGVVTAPLPQTQPTPLYDAASAMTDCGNWSESAHWDVPSTAVSGVYLALLTRDSGNAGRSTITFVVRDDASTADILVQTSDATWTAYNLYGGASLYPAIGGHAPGFNHATKASYNRPFDIRHSDGSPGDDLFAAEYAMIRWLERNGYDVAYAGSVDTDRHGAALSNHRAFVSVGHDEYWSGPQRAHVQAARDAGVHLAFFSGNEVYWKTRYEPSSDGTNTPYRTLVCFKEGSLGENGCGNKCDPAAEWTGLWRDGCAPNYAATDACSPENTLTGQIGWDGAIGAIEVPDTYKNLRFWRNTSIAQLGSGQTAVLGGSSLGSEWDWEQFGAFYPPRRIKLSETVLNGHTHHLSLYRAASGALVFGAGTIQWSWGLDDQHTFAQEATNQDMQQATVNLFADMGIAPESLQSGLVSGSASSDTVAPSSLLSAPSPNASVARNDLVTIQGVAVDTGGGVVAGVEVSTDGGVTWQAAQGTVAWTYSWSPQQEGTATILCRAFDDTCNLETAGNPGDPNAVTVMVTAPVCPCTVFPSTLLPDGTLFNDNHQPIELGMRFRTDTPGEITALRYYKPVGASGVHEGHLWSNGGQLLASAEFVGETASGWQQVALSAPVPVVPGTTYVVSYSSASGDYTSTQFFFTQASGGGPLHGLADGFDGPNGVFVEAATPAFPTQTFHSSNYWADVVFAEGAPDTTPPLVTSLAPIANAALVPLATPVRAWFDEPLDAASVDGASFELRDAALAIVPATVSYEGASTSVRLVPTTPLAAATTYTAVLHGGPSTPHIRDLAGNPLDADVTWTFTTAPASAGPFAALAELTPSGTKFNDGGQAIELGTRFRADVDGLVTALRYWKPPLTIGEHQGRLWTNAGALLATVTFADETASGWQEQALDTPVAITAGVTYVVSYWSPSGDYAATAGVFTSPTGTGLVHGLANGVDGANGVYLYTAAPAFPTSPSAATCYFADVVFYAAAPDVTPPAITAQAPAPAAIDVPYAATVTATFDEPLDPASVDGASVELRDAALALVPAVVTYQGVTNTVQLTPAAALAPGATYTAVLQGGVNAPHLTDLAGNPLAADVTWTFTTAFLPSCPCSVFAPGETPAGGPFYDGSPIEVGMRFRADATGLVTSLRFYKAAGTTGAHEGHLWTNSGTRLGTATFVGESASGWQEAILEPPVPIQANVTYVVSCFGASGQYASTNHYFATTAGTGLVHGLADGEDGANGLYAYTAGPTFPTSTFQSSNYFVDVVVYLPDQPRAEPYGVGCPGTLGRVPLLSALGLPPLPTQPNSTFGLGLANARPLAIGVLAAGEAAAPAASCALLIGDLAATWMFVTSATGTANLPLPIPPSPQLLGIALWLQGGTFDPAAATSPLPGLALSQGLRITIGAP